MIKGIKGGLSHAKKDKIKIEYDIEFQSLHNLPNDFNGHSLSIKWERGKNKGETKECKVVLQKPKSPEASSSHNNNDNLKPTAQNALVPVSGKGDTMSKKQSKLLIGSRAADTALVGGDCSAKINEKLTFKITLFSETQVSKDNSLTPNYEQKLMTLSIVLDNTTRCTTLVDLAMHSENNGSSPINIPFPSSSSLQPTLNMTIKTNYLKYNEKKIIKTSPPDSASTTALRLNGANNLKEIEGKVYLIGGTSTESDPPTESITRSNSWDEETDYTFQQNRETFLKTAAELKELHEKLQLAEKLAEEYKTALDTKDRSIGELTKKVEVSHARVLEYEEKMHRVQVLHDRMVKELNKERADFLNFKQLVASGKKLELENSSATKTNDSSKSTEVLALEQLNNKLKEQLQSMEDAWKEEKAALEESNERLSKLFQENKEKAATLRTALEKEMAKSNANDIKESELRRRITQEHEQEQQAKHIQQQPTTTSAKVRTILMKPLVAWFITVLMIMYLIFGDSS